ncbi:DUF308 domain-containing protein [Rhodobacteraceae bacterium KMM 6894]|nr:DUF308 domain-containing protein [Rhodobacteraceae bacterium KMM 6894]
MKEWLKLLLLGALSVAFGIFVLGNVAMASLAVTTLVGFLFLISGGFQVVAGFTGDAGSARAFSIIMGVLMAVLGLSFLVNPLEGMMSLTMLVLILLVASGVVRLVLAFRMQATPYFWPMLISGALSVLLAAYIMANFATASVSLLGIIMGIELLFNGAGLIVLAFFVRAVLPK